MEQHERRIIDDLFAKLGRAEAESGPRDPEAEALIQEHLARQPAAPYYMAQAIVVQQDALERAQARIEELERELASRPAGGGFLGGLFGGGEREPETRQGQGARLAGRQGPWSQPYGQGGGFLAGAAQTAMGVAGGVLIANAIASMFTPDAASAAEAGPIEDPGPMDEPVGGEDLGGGDPFADPGGIDFGDF